MQGLGFRGFRVWRAMVSCRALALFQRASRFAVAPFAPLTTDLHSCYTLHASLAVGFPGSRVPGFPGSRFRV